MTVATAFDPLLGFTADGLRFESLLGRGGMGAVYRGMQVGLERPVAIKVIAAHLAADRDYISRFAREARTLGRLVHPHVISCHDFAVLTGPQGEMLHVMVLEFVDGWSLGTLMKERRLSVRQALTLYAQAAEGLAAAHALGIIHRDIKPDNLMVTRQGQVKLADFGLARMQRHGSAGVDSRNTTELTQAGAIMGSPLFMSPEACRGDEPLPASDLYSLGCSMFQTLTGVAPFPGTSTLQVLQLHLGAPVPDIADRRPDLAMLQALVAWCLAKNPGKRPPDARTLAKALHTAAAATAITLIAGNGNGPGTTAATVISKAPGASGLANTARTRDPRRRSDPNLAGSRLHDSTAPTIASVPVPAVSRRVKPRLAILAAVAAVGALTTALLLPRLTAQGAATTAAGGPPIAIADPAIAVPAIAVPLPAAVPTVAVAIPATARASATPPARVSTIASLPAAAPAPSIADVAIDQALDAAETALSLGQLEPARLRLNEATTMIEAAQHAGTAIANIGPRLHSDHDELQSLIAANNQIVEQLKTVKAEMESAPAAARERLLNLEIDPRLKSLIEARTRMLAWMDSQAAPPATTAAPPSTAAAAPPSASAAASLHEVAMQPPRAAQRLTSAQMLIHAHGAWPHQALPMPVPVGADFFRSAIELRAPLEPRAAGERLAPRGTTRQVLSLRAPPNGQAVDEHGGFLLYVHPGAKRTVTIELSSDERARPTRLTVTLPNAWTLLPVPLVKMQTGTDETPTVTLSVDGDEAFYLAAAAFAPTAMPTPADLGVLPGALTPLALSDIGGSPSLRSLLETVVPQGAVSPRWSATALTLPTTLAAADATALTTAVAVGLLTNPRVHGAGFAQPLDRQRQLRWSGDGLPQASRVPADSAVSVVMLPTAKAPRARLVEDLGPYAAYVATSAHMLPVIVLDAQANGEVAKAWAATARALRTAYPALPLIDLTDTAERAAAFGVDRADPDALRRATAARLSTALTELRLRADALLEERPEVTDADDDISPADAARKGRHPTPRQPAPRPPR